MPEDAEQVTVILSNGGEFSVQQITSLPGIDLAVLRLDSNEQFPAAILGDSDTLEIGDWILTFGCPLKLEQTVSAGIISAKGRTVPEAGRTRLLQTDAAINPGSSGGALVNMRGEVVGITTAIASEDGGYQGIGFAIPINLAKNREGRINTGRTQ
jgi:serine protease Do